MLVSRRVISMILVGLSLPASSDLQQFRIPAVLQPGRYSYEIAHSTEHRFQYPRGKNAVGSPDRARKLDYVILGDVRLGVKPDSFIRDDVPGGIWVQGRTMREGEASWRLVSSLQTIEAAGKTETKRLPAGGQPLRQRWPWQKEESMREWLHHTHIPILSGLLPAVGPGLFDRGFDGRPRETSGMTITSFLNVALPVTGWKVTASR